MTSNEYEHYIDFLLGQLHAPSPHARALSYLILRALLGRLSGTRQVDAARRAVAAMRVESLAEMGDFMGGVDNLQAFIDDESLGGAVVLKPNSRSTLHRLQTAVLALVPLIPRPAGVSESWLSVAKSAGVRYSNSGICNLEMFTDGGCRIPTGL